MDYNALPPDDAELPAILADLIDRAGHFTMPGDPYGQCHFILARS